MKYRLMDLLACPSDKSWPLKLEVIEETMEEEVIKLPSENPDTGVICGFIAILNNSCLLQLMMKVRK